jgi:hypothetical protein
MSDTNKQEQQRRETNLKARMARSLVSDLLIEAGNDVYPIGYEDIVPQTLALEDALSTNKRLHEKLRAIPDLIVIDRRGMPHAVEVKFRWNPEGHVTDAKKLSKLRELWEESMVVFVNCSQKPYFRLSHAPYVNRRGEIITVPIESFESFKISHGLLAEFERLVVKYLSPTLFPGRGNN